MLSSNAKLLNRIVPSATAMSGMKKSLTVASGEEIKKLMEVKISEDETEASITLPGYSFCDLNRAGNLNMWSVAVLGEASRYHLYETEHAQVDFAGLKTFAENKLIFQLCVKYSIMSAFHEMKHMNSPVSTVTQLGKCGRTSLQILDKTFSAKTGELLHSATTMQCIVDPETRRPLPIPKWHLDKFKGKLFDTEDDWKRFDPLVAPDSCYSFNYKPVWSDTDIYYHVNQASYIRFCFNAVSQAAVENKLQLVPGEDFAKMKTKEMQMLYSNESRPTEQLVIKVWEDVEKSCIFCLVQREQTDIFHLMITL